MVLILRCCMFICLIYSVYVTHKSNPIPANYLLMCLSTNLFLSLCPAVHHTPRSTVLVGQSPEGGAGQDDACSQGWGLRRRRKHLGTKASLDVCCLFILAAALLRCGDVGRKAACPCKKAKLMQTCLSCFVCKTTILSLDLH